MDYLTDSAVITPILVVAVHVLTAAGFWYFFRQPPDLAPGTFHGGIPQTALEARFVIHFPLHGCCPHRRRFCGFLGSVDFLFRLHPFQCALSHRRTVLISWQTKNCLSSLSLCAHVAESSASTRPSEMSVACMLLFSLHAAALSAFSILA